MSLFPVAQTKSKWKRPSLTKRQGLEVMLEYYKVRLISLNGFSKAKYTIRIDKMRPDDIMIISVQWQWNKKDIVRGDISDIDVATESMLQYAETEYKLK